MKIWWETFPGWEVSKFLASDGGGGDTNRGNPGREIPWVGKTLIDTPTVNSNNAPACKEWYMSTGWYKYVKLKTFVTFHDDFIELYQYKYRKALTQ